MQEDLDTYIVSYLRSHAEPGVKRFALKLLPGVPEERVLGVRVPRIRELAKELKKRGQVEEFLGKLPHAYEEEDLLHAVLLSGARDFAYCLEGVEAFLPYVGDWMVCDTLNPKVFKGHEERLYPTLLAWLHDTRPYVVRFATVTLMRYYLREHFHPEVLGLVGGLRWEEYYVQMAQAWFVAEALVHQWDAAMTLLEGEVLSPWVRRKSIQKACESRRIAAERKELLRGMR